MYCIDHRITQLPCPKDLKAANNLYACEAFIMGRLDSDPDVKYNVVFISLDGNQRTIECIGNVQLHKNKLDIVYANSEHDIIFTPLFDSNYYVGGMIKD